MKDIYLDNAATSQKPSVVINAIKDYYENYNANIHRSIHKLGEEATLAYEEAHKKVAKFINANANEIIFTKGTTESINLLSYTIQSIIPKEKNEIILDENQQKTLKRFIKERVEEKKDERKPPLPRRRRPAPSVEL